MSEKKSLHRFFSIPLNKVNSAKSDSDFAAQQTVPKIIWHQRYNKHRFTPPNGTSHFCKAEIEPLPYRCGGRVLQLANSVRPYTICADTQVCEVKNRATLGGLPFCYIFHFISTWAHRKSEPHIRFTP